MNLKSNAVDLSKGLSASTHDTTLCQEVLEIIKKAWSCTNDKIIRISTVVSMSGRARSTLWKDARSGVFPKPFSIGARAVGWKASEVSAWMEVRAFATRSGRSVDMKAFINVLTNPQRN
jgi:prophage regulatory protein